MEHHIMAFFALQLAKLLSNCIAYLNNEIVGKNMTIGGSLNNNSKSHLQLARRGELVMENKDGNKVSLVPTFTEFRMIKAAVKILENAKLPPKYLSKKRSLPHLWLLTGCLLLTLSLKNILVTTKIIKCQSILLVLLKKT